MVEIVKKFKPAPIKDSLVDMAGMLTEVVDMINFRENLIYNRAFKHFGVRDFPNQEFFDRVSVKHLEDREELYIDSKLAVTIYNPEMIQEGGVLRTHIRYKEHYLER